MGVESAVFSAKSSFNGLKGSTVHTSSEERRRAWKRDLDQLEKEIEALEKSQDAEYSTSLARLAQIERQVASSQPQYQLSSTSDADLRMSMVELELKIEQEKEAQRQFQENVQAAINERVNRVKREASSEQLQALNELKATEEQITSSSRKLMEQKEVESKELQAKVQDLKQQIISSFGFTNEQFICETQALSSLEAEVQEALYRLQEHLTDQLEKEKSSADAATNELLQSMEDVLIRIEMMLR